DERVRKRRRQRRRGRVGGDVRRARSQRQRPRRRGVLAARGREGNVVGRVAQRAVGVVEVAPTRGGRRSVEFVLVIGDRRRPGREGDVKPHLLAGRRRSPHRTPCQGDRKHGQTRGAK